MDIKIVIWHLWLQVTPVWPVTHNLRSQAYTDVWLLWSCYVTWAIYSIFGKNHRLTPVIPNDPKSKFELKMFVKGVKLINMHESRDHAFQSLGGVAFSKFWKMTHFDLWPPLGGVTWQGYFDFLIFWCNQFLNWSCFHIFTWLTFSTPVTPNDF